jgi:uncharacterized protein YndB with AHSA1/START domain
VTQSTNIKPDQDSIVAEIHIAAPPERVFQALVDPEQVPKWWGQTGIYRCTEFHADRRPGGKWRTVGVDGQGRNFQVSGEYLEFVPGRMLVTTWVATWTGTVQTVVRWELERTERGTLVRLTHSGLAAHPELAKAYQGWPRMLGWLLAFIEAGTTVADRPAATPSR